MKTHLPFQPIVKDAYSHGLEDIYKLETIDISTVRRLGSNEGLPSLKTEQFKPKESECLSLDLGNCFRGWVEPSILDEPIDVLSLSGFTDKYLRSRGILSLRPLFEIKKNLQNELKGLGLGHLDEIEKKIDAYLQDKAIYRAPYVDFVSWLHAVFASYNRQNVYLLLKKYGLEEHFPLTFSDMNDIRKMNVYTAELTVKKFEEELKAHPPKLKNKPGIWAEAIMVPLAKKRFGLLSLDETDEIWRRCSIPSQPVEAFLSFISAVFFNGHPIVKSVFFEVQRGVYAIDAFTQKRSQGLLQLIFGYFFKEGQSYRIDELATWVNLELCRLWDEANVQEIERLLDLSATFTKYRGKNGEFRVRLAPKLNDSPKVCFL